MPPNFEVESTVPRIYSTADFGSSIELIQENFQGFEMIVAGSTELNFTASFHSSLLDGTRLTFEPVQDQLPVIMQDQEGNKWDMFGLAISGPRAGSKL